MHCLKGSELHWSYCSALELVMGQVRISFICISKASSRKELPVEQIPIVHLGLFKFSSVDKNVDRFLYEEVASSKFPIISWVFRVACDVSRGARTGCFNRWRPCQNAERPPVLWSGDDSLYCIVLTKYRKTPTTMAFVWYFLLYFQNGERHPLLW